MFTPPVKGKFIADRTTRRSRHAWQLDLNGLCRIFGHRKIARMESFQLHHPQTRPCYVIAKAVNKWRTTLK